MSLSVTESPQDYGLPADHGEWRPHQKEALDIILAAKNPSTIILEFPTGGGKTALAAATATKDKVLAMMLTKDLQDQYSRGYGFDVIYGRGNYMCTEPNRVKRWLKTYGYVPTGDDCPGMKECTTVCPYKQAKAIVIPSYKAAMNYSYSWYSEWWHKRGGYLFADEAHNLAISVISNLAQLLVSEKQRQRWDLPTFPACSGTAEWAIQRVDDWVHDASTSLHSTLKGMSDERAQAKGTLLLRKLQLLSDLIWQGAWYVKGTNIGEPYLSCRPINPSAFADRLLGKHSQRVLMSATIGNPQTFASGIGITDYEFHSFPHNIDPSHRPVFFYKDAPAMNWKSNWQSYDKQADIITQIVINHPHERVLIHVTTWKSVEHLAQRLARRGLQDRVWVPDKTKGRIQQIETFLHHPQSDLVIVSPSYWEGLDLKDDLCRAIIVAKVPFADRSDPVVAARLRQEGGSTWDHWQAALKVCQGIGRGTRHADDFCVGYIVDSNWRLVQSQAPSWFETQT